MVADIIENGERDFYNPPVLPNDKASHSWSFIVRGLRTTLSAPYSTGTVSITSGTATLSGGTWPTWAADGWLEVNGYGYLVSSRSSGTVLVLDDSSVSGISTVSYEINRWQYTLPDDFGGFLANKFAYSPDDNLYCDCKLTSYAEILQRRQRESWGTPDNQALYGAVTSKTSAMTTGQRFELCLWPTPNAAGVIEAEYYSNPSAIDDSTPYPFGGQPHAATLRAAVLAAAELEADGMQGAHYSKFLERLAASVSHDRRTGPRHLGNMNSSNGDTYYYRHGRDYITYNGTLYSG